ncbi:Zn-dependent hydrolase [Pseudanabaena sp. FACHB-2040]|uniref:Zn-dependent hydrolase n=1 Tax=Pseudanabaena sp. FACHB-2040 TaxID=2692859 RepID=UPI00168273A2|nr:Zn-dependent hydrolase [Pseudanabaena sp. FACHB-2040]MBD2258692.1 Zn-dependent hydrolase [Pseudanabaena sp. FACHB-2040]
MAATLTKLAINGDRLNERIARLAKIGRTASGSIRRLAFTPEDLQARYQVQQWMVAAGMTVRADAAGNLIGRYEGTLGQVPALATGSHIDTVPSGGCFDGVLGVLAGIEVVETLQQNQVRLQHPIEVIVFTDEENTMIGCQAIAGTLDLSDPKQFKTTVDVPIEDCLERIGGNWDELKTARRSRMDMAAFVELHVEQGAVLERQRSNVGVVQGVVGIRRLAITLLGEANHAGTTPMDMRQDALVAAAEIVLAVRALAERMPGEPVATVGRLEVLPNAVNIVPGRVTLSVDMRDLSKDCLDQMVAQLDQEVRAIASAHRVQAETASLLWVEPSPSASSIQSTIEEVCRDLGLSCCCLPSRAGHDALEMGRITDMGMIFVPSQAGISHSEAEYTSPEQCAQGANVLLHTLLKLDSVYPV